MLQHGAAPQPLPVALTGLCSPLLLRDGNAPASYNHHVGWVLAPRAGDGAGGPSLSATLDAASDGGRRRLAVHTPCKEPVAIKRENVRPCLAAPASLYDDVSPAQEAALVARPLLDEATPGACDLVGNLPADAVEQALADVLPAFAVGRVVEKLKVPPVDMRAVSVVGASSSAPEGRYNFKPESTLEPGIDSCWISAEGTAQNGVAREYIDYRLATEDDGEPGLRRVRYVGMRCPMPPAGPLAVKQFHLEALPLKEGASPQRTPTFHMLRLGAQTHVMQWFELPEPMECAALRLCCTKNFLGDELPYAHSIGFWEISFK